MKRATTTEEQIDILQKRGMSIANKKHATDVLLSVGYYRMGFYWFPFEICQDLDKKRNHRFNSDTTWEKAEALYNCVLKITYYILSKIDKNKEQELRSAIRQLVESKGYNSVQNLLEYVIY